MRVRNKSKVGLMLIPIFHITINFMDRDKWKVAFQLALRSRTGLVLHLIVGRKSKHHRKYHNTKRGDRHKPWLDDFTNHQCPGSMGKKLLLAMNSTLSTSTTIQHQLAKLSTISKKFSQINTHFNILITFCQKKKTY